MRQPPDRVRFVARFVFAGRDVSMQCDAECHEPVDRLVRTQRRER